MTKRQSLFVLALAALDAVAPVAAFADGEGLQEANTHLTDQAFAAAWRQAVHELLLGLPFDQVQVRFIGSRIGDDLGLTEKEVTDNLNFTGAKYLDRINVAMKPEDATAWLGKTPPDLSLEGRSRGPDWIYTYLKSFYMDESRPSGWNNTLLPNASMPNVLWQLQGIQHPVTEPKHGSARPRGRLPERESGGQCIKELVVDDAHKGQLTPEEYDQAARDISAFLQYVAEPAALQREAYGVWVILFMVFFSFLAYLLKHEYWRDVH